MLDRPDGTGTAATYGYKHLLQLLHIKIRQREGLTLDQIKAELKEHTGDALERRVASALASSLSSGAELAPPVEENGSYAWKRIKVASGIELHIREDSPAARESAVIALREAVRAALGREDIR
jgi:hypothetical protein